MTSTVGSRPPPDPVYVLRGHPTDVTAVIFVANNTLLASGDVAGNIIIWSFAIKRPITVWQAHGSGILALQQLCDSRLLSHGRDDQIHIWSLEGVASGGEPEKVYTLPVNALNFCGAAVFEGAATFGEEDKQASTLIAIPNLAESALIDIYDLKSEQYKRKGIGVEKPKEETGLCMCLRLFEFRGGLLLAAGYESGTVTIWDIQKRRMLWKEKLHDEPVLSLDVDIDLGVGVSGGADTKLVQFNLMPGEGETSVLRTANLKEQGVAAVRIRPDGKIAVSGGWDSKLRVYGLKKFKPLAVLQAHRQGIQCIAFPLPQTTDSVVEEDAAPANLFAAGSKDATISLWQIY